MKKIFVVYDDTQKTDARVKTIIGNKSFGNVVLKRKKLSSFFEEAVNSVKTITKFEKISFVDDFKKFRKYPKDTVFFHVLSSAGIVNIDDLEIVLEKLVYVNSSVLIRNDETIFGVVYNDRESYIDFLDVYEAQCNMNFVVGESIYTNCLVDLNDYNNLLMYISSGFDARYFNSLQGDNYIVTKRSQDKKKMKMEYSYYWLLPEEMKSWMVMPFNYKESENDACYTMERMPMTDIAIRWTHGAIDEDEFRKILDKIFYFFSIRASKKIIKDEYIQNANKLYLDKLDARIKQLKELSQYKNIDMLIKSGTEFDSIDEIVDMYKKYYVLLTKDLYKNMSYKTVIGHGDVFFANMLYSKETNFLRLIDPKGALEEKDLWMDPYYDIAKLSHSICGSYDFFNTGSYDIVLDKDMKFLLNIHFANDSYKEIFKDYLENNGYNYQLVRLYEASLFLSMLPLHIDNVHKVFGFVLNAIRILKEVECYV